MRSPIDFSSWHAIITTLLGLVTVSFVAVAVRLLVMQRVQQRRERANRQINERLKTLIAAYKTPGGSFTGNLLVDPGHLRELRLRDADAADTALSMAGDDASPPAGSDRNRRIRDAVEAALSDVILLGTADQVRLAARAAADMVAGRWIETAELVESLRDFIRAVLDLEPVPTDVVITKQGPLRAASGSARGAGAADKRAGAGAGGGGSGGAGMAAGGMMGMGAGRSLRDDPGAPPELPLDAP